MTSRIENWAVLGIVLFACASSDAPSSPPMNAAGASGGPTGAGVGTGGGAGRSGEPRFFARNVIREEFAAAYPDIDPQARVLASNVVYENHAPHSSKSAARAETDAGDSTPSDIASDNVEGALSETNVDVKKGLIGTWTVTNLGQTSAGQPKTGTVTFDAAGTYTVDAGYCEACGSWSMPAATSGHWFVEGNIIGFTYDGWNAPDLPVSRFAIVVHKRPNRIVYSIQGHTHGVERMDRVR